MTGPRLHTDEGVVPLAEDFDEDADTEATSVPDHLDEPTLAFIARIQRAANRRIAEAEARAATAIADAQNATITSAADDLEALAGGRAVLISTHEAAARVRSMRALRPQRRRAA